MKAKPITMTEGEYRELTSGYYGLCLECGAERECTEPDARKCDCPVCGEMAVYGAEELLIMGLIEFADDDNVALNEAEQLLLDIVDANWKAGRAWP